MCITEFMTTAVAVTVMITMCLLQRQRTQKSGWLAPKCTLTRCLCTHLRFYRVVLSKIGQARSHVDDFLKYLSKEISLTITLEFLLLLQYHMLQYLLTVLYKTWIIFFNLCFNFFIVNYLKYYKYRWENYTFIHKFTNYFVENIFFVHFFTIKGTWFIKKNFVFCIKKIGIFRVSLWTVTDKFVNLILDFESFSWDLWTQI